MLISRSVGQFDALSVSLSVSHKVIRATNSQVIVNRTSKFKSLFILSWFLPLLLATIKRSLKLRIFFVIPCNIELYNLVFRFILLAQTWNTELLYFTRLKSREFEEPGWLTCANATQSEFKWIKPYITGWLWELSAWLAALYFKVRTSHLISWTVFLNDGSSFKQLQNIDQK